MNVGDLLKILENIDPETLLVTDGDNGGTVTRVREVNITDLYAGCEDEHFAYVERFVPSMEKLGIHQSCIKKGKVVYIS